MLKQTFAAFQHIFIGVVKVSCIPRICYISRMLGKIQNEVDSYRKGGKNYGAFPERWLPAAVCVLPEPFTEQNHMVNSTMKIVRGKVEQAYQERMAYAYTPEGKNIVNRMNMESL